MHNTERDIINAIDEAIEPGPDAMHWTSAPDEPSSAGGSFGAILIRDQAEEVSLRPNVNSPLRELVGDPHVDHFEPVTGLDFWFGDESRFTSGPNLIATRLMRAVIKAVVTGDYAASDDDREHARELLSTPLVIHGPCLITGVDGAEPGPLPDAFLSWGTRMASYRQEQLLDRLAAALGRHERSPRDHR
jgi:hypothetical protein